MENRKVFTILVGAAVIIGIAYIFNNPNQDTDSRKTGEEFTPLSIAAAENKESIEDQLDSTLDVLMRIHYVSLTDKQASSPESVIVDELTESLNDLNKLKGLTYKTEELSKSSNEVIATTGLVLKVSVLSLIKTYETWTQYLRGFDINNADIAEFQYQLALFQSSTHDTYLSLVENATLLPMVVVEFANTEGEENSIDKELKEYFLAKIDEKFSDILVDNDTFYAKTKNRYAIAVLVDGYKDFLSGK